MSSMTVLGLDSAMTGCSVALIEKGQLKAERSRPDERGQAEILLPMVQETMAGARPVAGARGGGLDPRPRARTPGGPPRRTALFAPPRRDHAASADAMSVTDPAIVAAIQSDTATLAWLQGQCFDEPWGRVGFG